IKDSRLARTPFPHMVIGEAGQTITTEPVRARITEMEHMRNASAEHERGKSASHPRQLGVTLSQGVDPAVERINDLGGGASHFHGPRQVANPVQKTANRGPRCPPPPFRASNSIGDRRYHFAARVGQFRTDNSPGKILVIFARSGRRKESDAYPEAG